MQLYRIIGHAIETSHEEEARACGKEFLYSAIYLNSADSLCVCDTSGGMQIRKGEE